MKYRSDLAASSHAATLEAVPQGRRRHYRHKVRNLNYVSFDSNQGGIVRDLSQSGVALQAVAPLRQDQQIQCRLSLSNPRLQVEVEGRVAWTDSLGQAGVEFLNVSERAHRLLSEWLITQLLAGAHRATGDAAAGLLFSGASRSAISLDRPLQPRSIENAQPRLRLFWFTLPAVRFARLVDSVALLCAVMLFNVMALTMTDAFPTWPLAFALVLGTAAVFVGLYWLLFSVWFGITPGQRLAQLAASDRASRRRRERSRSRFR